MLINVTYDASASNAPAGFKAAVDAAVSYYESNFDAPVVINITVGWGTAAGFPIPDGDLGATLPTEYVFNYDQVRNALWSDARSPEALTAARSLPAADPTHGGEFLMTAAQAKAIGLVPSDDSASDGTIVIDPDTDYTFDPNNRAVPGKVDIIGVLEHEIGHVLGRVSELGVAQPDGSKLYGALDLFRYSAPGVRAPGAANGYFSIDGQHLLLPFNDPANGGSESDWSITNTGDVYDAFGEEGVKLQFSQADRSMLDLFGYHPHQAPPVTPTPSVPSSGPITVSQNRQVAQGTTVYFGERAGSSAVWGYLLNSKKLTNSGTIIASSPNGQASEVAVVRAYGAMSVFTNNATGAIYALATWQSADAYGFQGLQFGYDVDNAGLIQVVSMGNATGSSHAGYDTPSPHFTNRATGVVNVWADKTAIGVDFIESGIFNNAGLINSYGKDAIGVRGATAFTNSGTIRATNGDDPGSIAVAIYSGAGIATNGTVGQYNNSGTIQGDYAFYSNGPFSYSPIKVVNSGTIIGAGYFADSDTAIHNTGTIGGDIYFGNSTNLYDGANGAVYGSIYLGIGNDTITLGAASGIVYGGGGAATITGGAGDDFIQISRGDNAINGGGGFNILSFANADSAVMVDLGAGTATGGGTNTIQNIQEVIGGQYDDTLKAGNTAATLVAGSGHDTLIGGAGNDTLIAGDGGDTMTGGGGSDTFIYSAGDRQLVITDFAGNQDVLKIFGYVSAASVQQQGADTLITLAANDSILLKNTQSSSLTGVNLVYNAVPYAPPLLPFSAPSFGSSTILVDQDLRIVAGEHINETHQNIGLYNRGYSFDNSGAINVTYATASAADTTYGWVNSIFYKNGIQITSFNQSITNEAGASFAVSNSVGNAVAFQDPNGGPFLNAGSISVTAGGLAEVIDTGAQVNFTNTATGSVSVNAQGNAVALNYINAATIRNDGTFTVNAGGQAYWLKMGRAEGQSITNTGTVTVSVGPGGHSYGIAIAGLSTFGVATITNSGTLTAQDAIYVYDGSFSPTTFPVVNIVNSGTINGNITLGNGPNRIRNSGHINGLVRYADGNAVYDGTGGTLSGALYLGYGANTVTLGNDGEVVFADAYGGADTITGGSGDDIIQIGRGTHTINGGGGFNTVSFANAALGVSVDLGAGTASAAGTDTLQNIQKIIGSSFDDILKAGSTGAILVGGGGQDTLIGGAGNDMLVAGTGGGTMTGNGGNDTFVYSAGDRQLVITDFGANAAQDVLKIYGYASASSMQQQGADTLITLSANDKILLRNVLASSLTGGKLVYNAGALPADPALPAAPAMFGTSLVHFYSDLKIYAGEHVTVTGSLGLLSDTRLDQGNLQAPLNGHSLDNAGAVAVSSATGDVTGLNINPYMGPGGTFTNEACASFGVTASGGKGTGVFAGSAAPDIINAGQFSVSASTGAYGVKSYDSSHTVTNTQTGVMNISSINGDVSGLYFYNPGQLSNAGTITVSGKANVYGVQTYGGTVTNSGSITVSGVTQNATTYGLYLSDGGYLTLDNTGTISAQKAIFVQFGSNLAGVALTNNGTINGDLDLGFSNDIITSAGTINGNILLHDGRTTVDLRGGHFSGVISITPSYDGAYSNNTIYTTSAGATINLHAVDSSQQITVHGDGNTFINYDEASTLASWSANADGSWSVFAGAAGTGTLFNVQSLHFTDRTVDLVGNHVPVVSTSTVNAQRNQTYALSTLFSVHDADGDTITRYQLRDDTTDPTSGHFVINGVAQAADTVIEITAAQLAQTSFVTGTVGDNLQIRAYDGTAWSAIDSAQWSPFAVNVPVNHAPVITAGDISTFRYQTLALSGLFSVSDADGDAPTMYRLFDGGIDPTSGHFVVGGVARDAGTIIEITASQLAQTSFVTGSTRDTLYLYAFDGTSWSPDTNGFIVTPVNRAAVVTTANKNIPAGQSVALSSLFSVSDADGDAITKYQLRDNSNDPNSGHFVINGVAQAPRTVIEISASQLSQVSFVAGSTATDTLQIRAFDGTDWSAGDNAQWAPFTVTPVFNHPPVVTTANITAQRNQIIAASDLFTVTDADNDAITVYEFWDENDDPNSGHFVVNGVAQAGRTLLDIPASQLSQVSFVSGKAGTTDAIQIRAFDGTAWSTVSGKWAPFSVTVPAPPANHAPVVTTSNINAQRNQTIAASALFTVRDQDGDAITRYQFWDENDDPSSGHFVVNGVAQAGRTLIDIPASQLSQVSFVTGSGGGTDAIQIRAFDGSDWSAVSGKWAPFSITAPAPPANHAPVVATSNINAQRNQTIAASDLFTVSDSDNDAITRYQFWDENADPGSGHFVVNGVAQAGQTLIDIPASQLSQVSFVAGNTAGDAIQIRAFDGTAWSTVSGKWAPFSVLVPPPPVNHAPVVTTSNINAQRNQTIAASDLFTISDADNDSITRYQFWDENADPNSGHFVVNGVAQAGQTLIDIPASQLSQVSFVSGNSAGDAIQIRAFDGTAWSTVSGKWAPFSVLVPPPPVNHAPVVTTSNINAQRNQTIAASDLFTVSDADNDIITMIEFWDENANPGSGHFVVNGVAQAGQTLLDIPLSQLNQVSFVAGNTASDAIQIRAFDGKAWSTVSGKWSPFSVLVPPPPVNHAPVVTTSNINAQRNQTIAASALFTVSDPDNDIITLYEFWDENADPDSGHFVVNGVAQAGRNLIDVPGSQLSQVSFVAGNTAGDAIQIRAFDGTAWSTVSGKWAPFSVLVPPNQKPVLTTHDITATAGQVLTTSDLFTVSDPDGDAITMVEFWDENADPSSGHFVVGGAAQAGQTLLDIPTSQLSQVSFVAGSTGDALQIRAFDGHDWSAIAASKWSPFHINV